MDNAAIPGKSIHLPPTIEIKNVMSDEDRFLAKISVYRTMAEAGDLKAAAILALFEDDDEPVVPGPPEKAVEAPKVPLKAAPSEKQKAARKAAGDRLRAMHAEKRRLKELAEAGGDPPPVAA